jgi:hypothetical protein
MEKFDEYARLTLERNWKGICELNGVPYDTFGTRKEINILPNHLQPEEIVFALSSGMMSQTETSNALDFGTNTWLAVLTSERFLFLDCALLSSSVDVQSVRHDRVQAVSSSQGWVFGKIMIDLGSRMIVVDNCLKASVGVFSDLGNKWLSVRVSKASVATHALVESPLDKLEKLGKLLAAGIVTEDEFNQAKTKILASL